VVARSIADLLGELHDLPASRPTRGARRARRRSYDFDEEAPSCHNKPDGAPDRDDALLSFLCNGDQPEEIRGRAAISLGPVLEHADTEGFEDADDLPITERTFHRIQEPLRKLYVDASVPKEVRRRILEAAVRAPQDWHRDAIRAAYGSGDEAWRLTAARLAGGWGSRPPSCARTAARVTSSPSSAPSGSTCPGRASNERHGS
jgi:hypothetical protein